MSQITKPVVLDETGQSIVSELRRIADINENKIQSVNGKVGDVVLTSEDVGALSAESLDLSPAENSENPITSDGVYRALLQKEGRVNKVTSLSIRSSDTEYPSAKCVYDALHEIISDNNVDKTMLMGMIVDKEDKANRVTTLVGQYTDAKYPSAKCVNMALLDKEDRENKVTALSAQSNHAEYPSAKCVYDALLGKRNKTGAWHTYQESTIAGELRHITDITLVDGDYYDISGITSEARLIYPDGNFEVHARIYKPNPYSSFSAESLFENSGDTHTYVKYIGVKPVFTSADHYWWADIRGFQTGTRTDVFVDCRDSSDEYGDDYLSEKISFCESKDNMTYSLSASSTDTEYPSAKCVYNALALKQDRASLITEGDDITLADNTEYRLSDVSQLSLSSPDGSYACFLRITTADSGTVTIELPEEMSFVGTVPEFSNGETWLIYIENDIVVAGKAEAVST